MRRYSFKLILFIFIFLFLPANALAEDQFKTISISFNQIDQEMMIASETIVQSSLCELIDLSNIENPETWKNSKILIIILLSIGGLYFIIKKNMGRFLMLFSKKHL